jgi:hypothetical protein
MGRGGDGNFDCDTAMDFVARLVDQLVEQVQNGVAKPSNMEPDEYYGEVVPCIVDILAALHELTGTAAIPRPEVVAEWKKKYMEVWEATIDALGGSEKHKRARRAALRMSFDKLGRLSRKVFR